MGLLPKKSPAFAFVLEELEASRIAPALRCRPMFGCHSVYIGERLVFILRRKLGATHRDDGMWVAIFAEHRASLLQSFPTLRPVEMFQREGRNAFSDWLNLPESEDGFERDALEFCRLAIAGDARIGKIPKARKKKAAAQ
jgi:hypothetical protein